MQHPGIDLSDAAELADGTELFEMNGHCDAAIRKLRTLVVPGLEALPYDLEVEARRTLAQCNSVATSLFSLLCFVTSEIDWVIRDGLATGRSLLAILGRGFRYIVWAPVASGMHRQHRKNA